MHTKVLGFLLVGLVVFASVGFGLAPKAQAITVTYGNAHGYAWSSTVGWISLNCAEGSSSGGSVCATSNYFVAITAGTFSGYAWSENVGWISFNSADVSSCGAAGTINSTTGAVTGWARVLSGTTASGADGCINLGLSGSSPAYGLTYNTTGTVTLGSTPLPGTSLTGYAWGDVNTGWVNFDYATIDANAPNVNLYVLSGAGTSSPVLNGDTTPTAVPSTGGTVDMEWKTQSATSCTASATPSVTGWSGSVPVQNPTDWATVNTNTTYPVTFPANTTLVNKNYSLTNTCVSASGSSVSDTVTVVVLADNPQVNLLVNGVTSYTMPSAAGGSVTMSWTSYDMSPVVMCNSTVTPVYATSWMSMTDPLSSTGVSVTVPANTSTTTTKTESYSITCNALGTNAPYTSTVVVNVPPNAPTVNLQVNGTSGPYTMPSSDGGTATLSWTSQNVTSCTASDTPTSSDWTGSRATSGAGSTITLPANTGTSDQTYTYNLTCTHSSTPYSSSVNVIVPAPVVVPTGGTTTTTGQGKPIWQEF